MKQYNVIRGYKVLYVTKNVLFLAKGYKIYSFDLKHERLHLFASITDSKYSILSRCSILRRLMRAEVTGLSYAKNGNIIAVAKKGIFVKENHSKCFNKVFAIPRGSKPLNNICITPSGEIYFGEYFQNIKKAPVNVYGSFDHGKTWNVVYTFQNGTINHIHGLFFDKYTERIWLATGDLEGECIIGYTDDKFKSFLIVFRGGQEYRCCQLYFYPKYILFATDSQYMPNKINRFDRRTLVIDTICQIQGSAIKGGQSGTISFLSTTVEPSNINKEQYSHLWYTKDGVHWIDAVAYKKDYWPAIFQFGTIEFPKYESEIEHTLYYSGRALMGFDNNSSFISI